MKNKKLLIAGASAASLAALGLGAFAFFTDTVELNKDTKVGTVDIEATAEINHTQLKKEVVLSYPYLWENYDLPIYPNWISDPNLATPVLEIETEPLTQEILLDMFETAQDNLNPGDNMFQNDSDAYPGTDHEIIVNVTNEGSKSVTSRILFEITGTDAEGNALTAEELAHIRIYADTLNSVSGLTSGSAYDFIPDDVFRLREETYADEDLSQNNKYVLVYNPLYTYERTSMAETSFGQVFLNNTLSLNNFGGLLSGNSENHDNAETEMMPVYKYIDDFDDNRTRFDEIETMGNIPFEGTMKFDIAMNSVQTLKNENMFSSEALEALQKLENANINIRVIVQAMQLRNTNIDAWDIVFYEDFEV
jgi:hypothetical protein